MSKVAIMTDSNSGITQAQAKELGISMPITEQLYQVLFEHKKPSEAIYQLMTRSLKEEE